MVAAMDLMSTVSKEKLRRQQAEEWSVGEENRASQGQQTQQQLRRRRSIQAKGSPQETQERFTGYKRTPDVDVDLSSSPQLSFKNAPPSLKRFSDVEKLEDKTAVLGKLEDKTARYSITTNAPTATTENELQQNDVELEEPPSSFGVSSAKDEEITPSFAFASPVLAELGSDGAKSEFATSKKAEP